MKYDFTTLPDRHGRDAIAVDGLGKALRPTHRSPASMPSPCGWQT